MLKVCVSCVGTLGPDLRICLTSEWRKYSITSAIWWMCVRLYENELAHSGLNAGIMRWHYPKLHHASILIWYIWYICYFGKVPFFSGTSPASPNRLCRHIQPFQDPWYGEGVVSEELRVLCLNRAHSLNLGHSVLRSSPSTWLDVLIKPYSLNVIRSSDLTRDR